MAAPSSGRQAKRKAYANGTKEVAALKKRFEIESKLPNEETKKVLSECLAIAIVHLRILAKRQIEGELGSEESKGIPGTISTVRRLCDSLGTIVEIKKELKPL